MLSKILVAALLAAPSVLGAAIPEVQGSTSVVRTISLPPGSLPTALANHDIAQVARSGEVSASYIVPDVVVARDEDAELSPDAKKKKKHHKGKKLHGGHKNHEARDVEEDDEAEEDLSADAKGT